MFRALRITVLLLVLLFVALNTWLDRVYSTAWRGPLQVALYPVNVDGSAVTDAYLATLEADDFRQLEEFFAREAQRHALGIERPLRFTLAPRLPQPPPAAPTKGSSLSIGWWSLKLRWFAWNLPNPPGPTPTIRVFLLYHDPANLDVLPDSLGLQKGLLGVAHLFADARSGGTNQVVIAHEALHTLGATDKYDLLTDQPIFPDGLAEPDRSPRYPQERAELMAGRIAITPNRAEQPDSLRDVVIGPLTATEIGWNKTP